MNYSIAIDGPSGAGKSTLAKRLAKHFNYIYIDTGAIYRTVGLYAMRKNTDRRDESAVEKLFPEVNIEIRHDDEGLQRMLLNGEDVSDEIRFPEVSIAASDVSALPAVRVFLLEMQRKFAMDNSVILDGRDIGTVVLPNADCKIFLTASSEERARRRMKELEQKGTPQSFDEVLRDIEYRDYQDTHRDIAPLRKAEDAIVLDTSRLSFDESFNALVDIINTKIGINR